MPYRHRRDAPDAISHVTGRVNWQVWHFEQPGAPGIFLDELAEASRRFGVSILSHVLMSNHYHFVARCPPPEDYRRLTLRHTPCRHLRPWPVGHLKSTVLGQFMHRLMHRCATRLLQELEIKGHLWEGRYHRRGIEDALSLVVAMAYDHRNPVRAGIVDFPEDYALSSAPWWAERPGAQAPRLSLERLPFGLGREELAAQLRRYQARRELDAVMAEISRRRMRSDSPRFLPLLTRLLEEAGIPPYEPCGSAAALRRP